MTSPARAERRRQEREAGKHRSPNKRGRRPALRTSAPELDEDSYDALEAAGFVVARYERTDR